jgi:hypothetical protein
MGLDTSRMSGLEEERDNNKSNTSLRFSFGGIDIADIDKE